MKKFIVTCNEQVSTELVIEADNLEQVEAWIHESNGRSVIDDLVANNLQRQFINSREYTVWGTTHNIPTDFILKGGAE